MLLAFPLCCFIQGSINKFIDKCNNFVMWWNSYFTFKPSLKKYICNPFQELETSSCMRLCSMATLATAETPHSTLLFLEACFHIQNSITSAFDVQQSLKLYHCIQQNQSFNLPLLYDAKAFYVKITSEWNCFDMWKFSVILWCRHFCDSVMYWIANFDHILLFAGLYTGWNREMYV